MVYFYLIRYDNFFERLFMDTIQNLFKNYPKSRIFQFLLYSFINVETLISPGINPIILYNVSSYLIEFCKGIDIAISQIEKKENLNIKSYVWNYKKLHKFIDKKYGYNWILDNDFYNYDIVKFVNESNEDHYISFRLREGKHSIYIYNSKYKKGKILYQHDFIKQRAPIFSKEQKKVNLFMSLCDPSISKFVLSILSESIFYSLDPYTEKILTKDDKFIKALESAKSNFDKRYNHIMNQIN